MSKKASRKPETPPPAGREPKQDLFTVFSRMDSKHKHRILAYLVWLLGIFIILFAYRAG